VQVDQLVAELLARGDMNDDTVVELNRMLDDWRAGRLDPADADYLRSLHARIFETEMVVEPDHDATAATVLEGLDIAGWRDRALRAEADLQALREATKTG
jgi:hypothetical protein